MKRTEEKQEKRKKQNLYMEKYLQIVISWNPNIKQDIEDTIMSINKCICRDYQKIRTYLAK